MAVSLLDFHISLRHQLFRQFLYIGGRRHNLKVYDDYSTVVNKYLSSRHAEKIPINKPLVEYVG
jgi:hypothetical protein